MQSNANFVRRAEPETCRLRIVGRLAEDPASQNSNQGQFPYPTENKRRHPKLVRCPTGRDSRPLAPGLQYPTSGIPCCGILYV